MREQGGILGQRFGSSLATGEALLRSEADASLDQLIGGILEQGRQFDTGLLSQTIGQQFGFGSTLRDQDFRNQQSSIQNFLAGTDLNRSIANDQFNSQLGRSDLLRQSLGDQFGQGQANIQNQFQQFGLLGDLNQSQFGQNQQNVQNQLAQFGLLGDVNQAAFGQGQQNVQNQLQQFGVQSNVGQAAFGQDQANIQNLLQALGIQQGGISNLFGQGSQVANQDTQLNQQTLQGIQDLFGQAQGNLAPFLQLMFSGILPEEIIKSPGVKDLLLSLVSGAGSAAISSIGGGA